MDFNICKDCCTDAGSLGFLVLSDEKANLAGISARTVFFVWDDPIASVVWHSDPSSVMISCEALKSVIAATGPVPSNCPYLMQQLKKGGANAGSK